MEELAEEYKINNEHFTIRYLDSKDNPGIEASHKGKLYSANYKESKVLYLIFDELGLNYDEWLKWADENGYGLDIMFGSTSSEKVWESKNGIKYKILKSAFTYEEKPNINGSRTEFIDIIYLVNNE